MKRNAAFTAWLLAILTTAALHAQQPPDDLTIGIIDFYGMNKLSPETLRAALPFKEGDSVRFSDSESVIAAALKAK